MTTHPTILIVVDDIEIRSAMAHLLKINDYVTLEAPSTDEALARAPHENFDLILFDCDMPLGDSLDAARRIRAQASNGDLPMVVIDTYTTKKANANDIATVPNEHIVNVIHLDQLINLLSYILHRHSDAA